MSLNADGSIARIIPLGKAAIDYIERTGLPSPGQPFVSPIEGGVISTLLVVFQPNGNVQVFLKK